MDHDEKLNPRELLSRAQIAQEYGIAESTQRLWYRHNVYGWRDLTIAVGGLRKVMRKDVDRWLESRKGLVSESKERLAA